MMREIKFRAWFELEKKMVESQNLGLQYEGDEEEAFTFAFDKTDLVEQENGEFHEKGTLCFELMQYTGLKDKNGREIYEGDIVKGKAYEFNKAQRIIGEVEYCYCEFKVVGLGRSKGIKAELNTIYEVIGNIYENPELLEGAAL